MINLLIFLAGIAIMLFLMMKTKLGAFVCMLIASLGIGIACGLGSSVTIDTIVTGFANTCKSIGLLVIFGTILGIYLEKSNACQKIATFLLKLTGRKNCTAALAATGFVIAIPVFCDVAMVLLSPLIKSVAKKSNKNACALGTVTACSLLSTNAFVAPTPAPLAIIAVLGLDIGTSIIWGLPVAFFITVCVWAFCEFYLCKKPESWYTRIEVDTEADEEEAVELPDVQLPSLFASMLPILLPIILILLASILKVLLPAESTMMIVFDFLGIRILPLPLVLLYLLYSWLSGFRRKSGLHR